MSLLHALAERVTRVTVPPSFDAWRELARKALLRGLEPDSIDLADATVAAQADDLFGAVQTDASALDGPYAEMSQERPHVPRAFLDRAKLASYHRDPQRWNLLYRLLWRLQSNRDLMRIEVDHDVSAMLRLVQQVKRDEHKMHAFVRFRRIEGERGEEFIAWYEPAHRILELAAPFFAERFAVMRWSILTPDGSAYWDPELHQLQFGPPLDRTHAPAGDELETLWKSYYGSIFNPARLNPEGMRSHMPVKYWNNLPEVELLPSLLQAAEGRVESMISKQGGKPSAAPFVPHEHTLPVIQAALPTCRGCDLYEHAIQVVPGRGPVTADLVLVGEQPGDQEDKRGEPFVGPAGGVLRKALAEAGVDPDAVYMTNAVKHFKFVQRGKLRLHQNPRMSEITACKPWLMAELDALKPKLVVALGASAAKSLLGGTFALMRDRGKLMQANFAEQVMATIHPSAVLRGRDDAAREQLYRHLRDDLMLARQYLGAA
ncbi:UdgX family uracil-DNA binding protein [Terriglobus aquaticus]|uniref:Type-4 uracil-DNA glycosylase n=1 Tax=Terriglobus aquaticus TaxID=940139 RepID=A0ABW9KJ97_9BACT|nr:UdgX family uracil-DNA binding protein [Terriglobus aquaticus]